VHRSGAPPRTMIGEGVLGLVAVSPQPQYRS